MEQQRQRQGANVPLIKYRAGSNMDSAVSMFFSGMLIALVLISLFLIMLYVIFYGVFVPKWNPASCVVQQVQFVDPMPDCPISDVRTGMWTFEVHPANDNKQTLIMPGCASYYAEDSIVGGTSCRANRDVEIYPYSFRPFPLWWCTKCSNYNCSATVSAKNGTVLPCFYTTLADGSPLPFAALQPPYLSNFRSLWTWVFFALVCTGAAFLAFFSCGLHYMELCIQNEALSDRWMTEQYRILFALSEVTDVLWTWFVLSRLHIAPDFSFQSASLIAFLMWLIWLTARVALILTVGCDHGGVAAAVPLLNWCVACCGFSSQDSEFIRTVFSNKILFILYVDSWCKLLPFLVVTSLAVAARSDDVLAISGLVGTILVLLFNFRN